MEARIENSDLTDQEGVYIPPEMCEVSIIEEPTLSDVLPGKLGESACKVRQVNIGLVANFPSYSASVDTPVCKRLLEEYDGLRTDCNAPVSVLKIENDEKHKRPNKIVGPSIPQPLKDSKAIQQGRYRYSRVFYSSNRRVARDVAKNSTLTPKSRLNKDEKISSRSVLHRAIFPYNRNSSSLDDVPRFLRLAVPTFHQPLKNAEVRKSMNALKQTTRETCWTLEASGHNSNVPSNEAPYCSVCNISFQSNQKLQIHAAEHGLFFRY